MKLFKLVFYLLAFIFSATVALFLQVYFESAADQGLAAGAIVMMYSLFAGLFGLIVSIIMATKLEGRHIRMFNWMFVLGIIVGFLSLVLLKQYRDKAKEVRDIGLMEHTTEQSDPVVARKVSNQEQNDMGMGFFKPNFYRDSVLYFYRQPNLEKSVMEHAAFDSLLFKQSDGSIFEITYAPPWFYPAHMKMDYEMLFMNVRTVYRDFLEIEVNKMDGRTTFVDRFSGKMDYWPEFIMSVNSVEWYDDNPGVVRIKPMEHASEVVSEFSFMQPVGIRGEWLKVRLVDDAFKETGKGWIRWRVGETMSIKYNLLS